MSQNKVKDNIFKILLRNEFSKEDIITFLNISNEFNEFKNFIYYIFLLSEKKYETSMFEMCRALNTYLCEVIKEQNIEPLSFDDIKTNTVLSNHEISLLGAKGYGSFHNMYFDIDDNMYINLDNINFNEYKSILNIAFNSQDKSICDSKINRRILDKNFNKILCFKNYGDKNIFVGFYKFEKLSFLYDGSQQLMSFILVSESSFSIDDITEYDNLNQRNQFDSLNILKMDIKELLYHNIGGHKLLETIEYSSNHYCLFNSVIQFLISKNDKESMTKLLFDYPILVNQDFNIFKLNPWTSHVSAYELVMLANTFDILYGIRINSDYMNNIHICFDVSNFNKSDDELDLRFVKSYTNKFFDLLINKLLFNTSKQSSAIYVWNKVNNKYQFINYFKVNKIVIGKDLKDEDTPIFKLRILNNDELINHFLYIYENSCDNNYKNMFIDIIKPGSKYSNWIKNTTPSNVVTNKKETERNNSILFKYNWIIKKCLLNINKPDFQKYLNAYTIFDNKTLSTLLLCLSNDIYQLTENRIMEPWTIAYELSKQNFSDEELLNICYIDYYITKEQKYSTIIDVLKKSNFN
ncbi:MAG: hypothetical protein ACRC4M_00905 [Mycoplasma sp.]